MERGSEERRAQLKGKLCSMEVRKQSRGVKCSATEVSLSIMLWLITQRFTQREQMTLWIINYTKTGEERRKGERKKEKREYKCLGEDYILEQV